MIIVAYCTSNNKLAIELGQLTSIPIFRDNRLSHLGSYGVVIDEAHFVLECPLNNMIRVKFPSILQKSILEILESFF